MSNNSKKEKLRSLFGGALRSMLSSKKALASLTALIAAGIAKWLKFPTDEIVVIISPVIAYVLGQGIADHGKEKAKIENGSNPTTEQEATI